MRIILNYTKDSIKDYTPSKDLKSLIEMVSEVMSEEEYRQHELNKLKFKGEGDGDWTNENRTVTSKEWLSLYKYDQHYGNWRSQPQVCPSAWKGNILDFGAGSGTPWVEIRDDFNLYLVEANLLLAEGLRESYKNYPNVKVVGSLKEVEDVKFDYIYSKDVVEHVRFVDEHFDIFYMLLNPNGHCNLLIDASPSGGHVWNLHEDTTPNPFWSQYIS